MYRLGYINNTDNGRDSAVFISVCSRCTNRDDSVEVTDSSLWWGGIRGQDVALSWVIKQLVGEVVEVVFV